MPENPLSTITKLDPLFMEQMKKLDDFIYGEGVLPRKFKYLIAMAFDAVDGAGDGVGFLARAAHALTANFVTYNRNGGRTPNVARVGSVFAAEFTGNLWMLAGYRDGSQAVRGVGMQLGVSSAFNLIREFAPELKLIFTRR